MAFDSLKPATSDNYSSAFTQNIRGNFLALAMWLDSAQVSITGTVPTYAKRYNRSSGFTEEYSGSAWANLVQNINGNAATATDAGKLGGQAPLWYQPALGFTPVQQGGGAGQGASKVFMGWDGTGLALQVDTTNYARVWPIGVTGNAGTVTSGVYTTGDQTIGGTKTYTGPMVRTMAGADGTQRAAAIVVNKANGTIRYQFGIESNDSPILWTYDTAGAYNGSIQFAGGAVTASGNVTAYSDERLKKDWAPVASDFVAQLAGLKSGSYTRIDTGERQAGVSAQSLRAVLPEAVKDDGQWLSVAYGNAAMVACIELARVVVAMRAELDTLKARA